jgi:hypothetical protein
MHMQFSYTRNIYHSDLNTQQSMISIYAFKLSLKVHATYCLGSLIPPTCPINFICLDYEPIASHVALFI